MIERTYLANCVRGYIEKEAAMLSALADGRRGAIDVGAHKGVFTLFLTKYHRRVYCFEPNPDLATALSQKFGENVEVHACALGRVKDTAVLHIPLSDGVPVDSRSTLTNYFDMSPVRTVSVPVRVLDEMKLSEIGFMKIDVEGFERDVLEGGKETIIRERPRIYIEIEQRFHPSKPIAEIFSQIRSLGYAGFFFHDGDYQPLTAFSVGTLQMTEGDTQLEPYINNFLFLPEESIASDLRRLRSIA
jgi:FkbM family methyltransferase